MYWIDTASATTPEPTRPAVVSGTEKFFTDSGTGTILPDWWLNMLQKELLNVLTEGGVTPDKADDTQVITAINNIITAGITADSELYRSPYYTIQGTSSVSTTPVPADFSSESVSDYAFSYGAFYEANGTQVGTHTMYSMTLDITTGITITYDYNADDTMYIYVDGVLEKTHSGSGSDSVSIIAGSTRLLQIIRKTASGTAYVVFDPDAVIVDQTNVFFVTP